ncbi:MAG: hypothetical protein B6229_03755 [Spirochaetaceae bacterium 4572_7]|nr:MAG: hypothetical protein B6229_03755 [Spirochaetaceae bacterium 4572_7]
MELKLKKKKNVVIVACLLLSFLAFVGVFEKSFDILTFQLDETVEKHLEELALKSGASYAVTRGLNSVISVLQESDLNLGLSTIAVGQVLDPINDLVEKTSSILLLSTISLVLQNIFYDIGIKFSLTILLSIFILLYLVRYLLKEFTQKHNYSVIIGQAMSLLLISIIILRLFIPIVAGISIQIDKYILSDKYDNALSSLEELNEQASHDLSIITNEVNEGQSKVVASDNIQETEPKDIDKDMEEVSLFAKVKKIGTNTVSNMKKAVDKINPMVFFGDIVNKMDTLKQKLKDATEHLIDIILVFTLQTIILPILTFFVFKKVLGLMYSYFEEMLKIRKLSETTVE